MKIRVKGFLTVKQAMGGTGELELDVEAATLRDVLSELSNRYGDDFQRTLFDPQTDRIRPQNQILINGRHYRYLANGLDVRLSEGDVIALFPQIAGGRP